MSKYYLKPRGQDEHGPYTAPDLKRMAKEGVIDATHTFVRAEGQTEWHLASNVKGLFPVGSQPNTPEHDAIQAVPVELPPPLEPPEAIVDATIATALGGEIDDVDEQAIARSVRSASAHPRIAEEWRTPSGKMRSQPMYVTTVRNGYLNKVRTIKKSSHEELVSLAVEQIQKWQDQEVKQRVSEERARLTQQGEAYAAQLTRQAQEILGKLQSIAAVRYGASCVLDWNQYFDMRVYPPFAFEPEPDQPPPPRKPAKLAKGLIHRLLPFLWDKAVERHQKELENWERRCRQIHSEWQRKHGNWKLRREKAQSEHQRTKEEFHRQQESRNQVVREFQRQLEEGNPEAIVRYLEEVLSTSVYPPTFNVSADVTFDNASETVVVDLSLPTVDEVSDVLEYKYIKARREILPVKMKEKDHKALYDDAVRQAAIRTMYEMFASLRSKCVAGVVANGWVTYVDRATGHEKNSCILSVSADREAIVALDLSRVDAAECLARLKGVIAGPLSEIAPVQPIMHLNRDDGRFVESQKVLAELESTTNLAEIGWEEFEHVVRELFEAMFSAHGAEVKVTQASKDGGVDAIAFDSDPIRGGKFVIQAKRYTNVVPVSSVRDLYGTMIAEGASKGILVTTAHFGRDSREFVKDKPISLIDGSNLVYLLEQHGHRVRIDVAAARAKQDRNPLQR